MSGEHVIQCSGRPGGDQLNNAAALNSYPLFLYFYCSSDLEAFLPSLLPIKG